MTWLWGIFTYVNIWWLCAFIVIAFQHQKTDRIKKTVLYSSLLAAACTGIIAALMEQGIIRFI
jgi:hypothetical protein